MGKADRRICSSPMSNTSRCRRTARYPLVLVARPGRQAAHVNRLGEAATHIHRRGIPSAKAVGHEGTSSSGQACPHGLKEKTNREKTKVATMGIE
jgi:hypothetical protein